MAALRSARRLEAPRAAVTLLLVVVYLRSAPQRFLAVVLAALLLASAYAVAALNNTSGDVFFACTPALLLGLMLCAAVLLGEVVAVGRRVYEGR